ncbi:MAG: methyltransferase domain-containing protein [Clostridiales bacterium]|nr:methyltransferase domain-containing protein [Clostridiales bacterium]
MVISRLAFHHFSEPQRCFSEMASVLKPGGSRNRHGGCTRGIA